MYDIIHLQSQTSWAIDEPRRVEMWSGSPENGQRVYWDTAADAIQAIKQAAEAFPLERDCFIYNHDNGDVVIIRKREI